MSQTLLTIKDIDPYRTNDEAADAWLGLGDLEDYTFERENPLIHRTENQIENPGLMEIELMISPEYLHYACKILLNIDLIPMQAVILEELWVRAFPMFIMSRGGSKSFLLAVYSLLRCILVPGTKVVICGAAFRQSKIIFEYMETVWNNAPILRDICNSRSGPRRDVDRCTMYINDSWAVAIPLGSGEKIRGLRAHIILADEFSSISPDIYETVISGFAAVSADPIDNVKKAAERKIKRESKKWTRTDEEIYAADRGNQAILSGTCGYDFEHFATYWKRYKAILNSRGNEDKLRDILGDDTMMDNFNWKDYSIIRIPYELIPEGFMDDKTIMRAKATMHSSIFTKEYGACLSGETKVITNIGCKNIKDVMEGDMVLTHRGRFRPVTEIFIRPYKDDIVNYSTYGYFGDINITPDHLCWKDNDWLEIENIEDNLDLAHLTELSGLKEITSTDYCTNFLMTFDEKYIYAKNSASKLNNKQISYIRKSYDTQKCLAKKFGVVQTTISCLQKNKNIRYKKIPIDIPLNYDTGLVFGYYLAEGSIGAKGRTCEFALDGHKEQSLLNYIEELKEALLQGFSLKTKIYHTSDNCVKVCVNSRLFAEMIKKICPGLAHTKNIDPDILFSNEEFLKGVIVGYFNGDGCIRQNRKFSSCLSVSSDLINQIHLALSYFGIFASYEYRKPGITKIRDKEYNCREGYILKLHGKNDERFKQIFYNMSSSINRKNGKHINSYANHTNLNIKYKHLIPYDGYVYNLEVEEDNSYSLLNNTVHNCFPKDSTGFFPRTLIESCVASDKHPVELGGQKIWFDAVIQGRSDCVYVYGVDPAVGPDNFSIVILEVHPEHTRIVYCWTTNMVDFRKRKSARTIKDHDYYGFCARKIRSLMTLFPTSSIAIDTQGGGIALEEALHDPDKMEARELPLWPVVDPEKEALTDDEGGLHILHMCQFANAKWTAEANHTMRKDMENKTLLFPRFDPVSLAIAADADGRKAKELGVTTIYDSLEDCVMELEELKDELSTIVLTNTGSGVTGRERWDTPETQIEGGKKGRLRKDRYSALVMASMISRSINRQRPPMTYDIVGGFAGQVGGGKAGPLYKGPDWFTKETQGGQIYGTSVNRNR